jgi:hypothetical protein
MRTSLLKALAVQESAYHDFTHEAVIRGGVEITEMGVATPQTFQLGKLIKGSTLERVTASLAFGFQDRSDVAFNTTTVTVKIVDAGGADKTVIFTALEVNMWAAGVITNDQVFKTATNPAVTGDKLVAIVTGMAGKSLGNLDEGTLNLYFDFNEPVWLNEGGAGGGGTPAGLSLLQEAELTGRTEEEVVAARAQEQEARAKEQEEAAAKKEGGEAATASSSQQSYDDYTVAELKEQAKKRGVEIPSDARKDEIIDALEKADKEKS